MSSDVDQASETKPPYRGDDRILIPGILATFTVAVLGSTRALEMDAIVTAVFLASGVAMLVFRFLGGISSETSFNTGAFRVGGSLAALIGCAWYFNGELRSTDIETIFEPKYTTWVPIDKSSGALVDLKVNKKSVPFAREEVRKNLAGIDRQIAAGGDAEVGAVEAHCFDGEGVERVGELEAAAADVGVCGVLGHEALLRFGGEGGGQRGLVVAGEGGA